MLVASFTNFMSEATIGDFFKTNAHICSNKQKYFFKGYG